MATLEPDEGNVPWGKYNYQLEGLATGCYMEGVNPEPRSSVSSSRSSGQRLRFRVELPARCFVLSVAVKLPNAPSASLVALDDIVIERALSNGDYHVVYDPAFADPTCPTSGPAQRKPSNLGSSNDPNNDSPTAVDQTSATPEELPRKKVMEVHRAADSLRLTVTDIDQSSGGNATASTSRPVSDSDDASETTDFRTLGVVVVGYIRGQTPASNRLKILLNSSARLHINAAKADRAEVDGLLGLAFLASRRYRQAAELLQRASELILSVANDDAKAGFAVDAAVTWAAELNLLSAHAYFEHMPVCNDGIVRLILVSSAGTSFRLSQTSSRDVRVLTSDFLDLRTELLSMLQPLIKMLVRFLAESSSPAVRMASARMVEFISEQLGCGMAPHMSTILNHVLRAYPSLVAFGARERAAASSFSYDSMEDCFERLIDICCRLFPLTEHSVLHRLYDNTLVPVFLDAFLDSDYLQSDPDGEEPNELLTTAVAQTLRVIYLVLSVLGADARVPTSLVTRVLDILVLDSGCPKTPLLLRRTGLHAWDALSRSLIQAASGNTVKAFEDHIKMLTSYIPKLLVETIRVGFEYRELEEDNGAVVKIFKDDELKPDAGNEAVSALLRKRKFRTEIADRHTLRRLLMLIREVCAALVDTDASEDDLVHSEVVFSLQQRIGQAIADVFMSNLLDVSYHEAVASGIGAPDNSTSFEFGHISNQLLVVSEVLDELFGSYWACLLLLPSRMSEEAVRTSPIRVFLGWCVDRMKYSAPPQGMLQLMKVCVKGLMNDLSVCMFGASKDPANPSEVTFLSIYRAHLMWLPQAAHEEAFDLLDLLNENVAGDLLARDVLLIVKALGDQRDDYQARTETSLESIATIIAAATPKDPEMAVKSLRELPESMAGKQRLSHGFPKSPHSGSFNKKMNVFSGQAQLEPMVKAFYLHVVLSSCFNRFDSLAVASERRAGPSFMGDKIDAFVEHAALAVRSLHACARSQSHREYVGAILGDIFGTCLAMEDHTDGRVRLAGFEIFAASLDVLFLAQKTTMLGAQQGNFVAGDTGVLNAAGGVAPLTSSHENVNGVMELSPQGEDDSNGTSGLATSSRSLNITELSKSNVIVPSTPSPKANTGNGDSIVFDESDDAVEDSDRRMHEILSGGGTWGFNTDETSSDELAFEQRAWQMLCAFISSNLGVGKYVDFVVQRACLEYLRNCMMNALRGRSSGASVISFEHIDMIWEAVSRLVGSPWRALNSLAMWVICAVVNVSVFATVTAKARGAVRQRSAQLTEFITTKVFPRSESLLKNTSRENRVWGMRLLEVYIRARDMNSFVAPMLPQPSGRMLRCLQTLKNDWHDDVRQRSMMILQVHYGGLRRKTTSLQSLTAQAQNFMYIKRHSPDELETTGSSRVELWFPPLPQLLSEGELKVYQSNLDAFASNEIMGGEEVDLVKETGEDDDDEEDDGAYDYDEDGYELDVDAKIEAAATNLENSQEEAAEGDAKEDTTTQAEEEDNSDGEDATEQEDDEDEEAKPEDTEPIEQPAVKIEPTSDIPVETGSPDSSSSSTDAEAGSEPDEMEPPSNLPELPVKDIPKDETDEQVEEDEDEGEDEDEDEDEDNEFSKLNSLVEEKNATSEFVTRVSDVDDDVDLFVDDEEEDVVVDVTDEEDVLVDVAAVSEGANVSRSGVGSVSFNALSPAPQRPPSDQDAKLKRPGTWSRVNTGSNMNPDLDEGKTVLRRKGSFTFRPSTAFTLEEGDAPKLARRRSVDVTALASNAEGGEDADDAPSRAGSRISRRNSSKVVPSVLKSSEGNRSRTGDGSFSVKKGTEGDESSASPVVKLQRRRSLKNVIQAFEEKDMVERKWSKERDQFSDNTTGPSSISTGSGSFKGPRIVKTRGEESVDDATMEARPTTAGGASFSKGRASKVGSDALPRPGPSKPGRRSLPRAPAFLMGGGLQRRNSGPLIGGGEGPPPVQANSSSAGVSSGSGNTSVGDEGTGAPGLGAGGRPRLPRGKSHGGRLGRVGVGLSDSDGAEQRSDRSHRFGRREPLKLDPDAPDEFEELFNDVEQSVDDEGEKQRSRSRTPTGDSLMESNSLADEMPSADAGNLYKRRTSKRDVLELAQYRGFLDELGTKVLDEPSPSRGGVSSSGAKKDGDHRGTSSSGEGTWKTQ